MAHEAKNTIFDCCEQLANAEAHRIDRASGHDIVLALYNALRSIVPASLEFDFYHRGPSLLSSGRAIAPHVAAKCLMDGVRTSTYMRAMMAAVQCVRERIPAGERVRILYAGTGPFAPHIIPLTMYYSPDDIAITAVDIHRVSLDTLMAVADILDIRDFFADFISADLTIYRHRGPSPHIILTETMCPGLLSEPQAAITRRLLPQLHPDGVFVPACVSVDAFAHRYYHEHCYPLPIKRLGNVCALDAAHPDMLPSYADASFSYAQSDGAITGISLVTRVDCFESCILHPETSDITCDLSLAVPCLDTTDHLRIQYDFGGIKVSVGTRDAQTGVVATHPFWPLHRGI